MSNRVCSALETESPGSVSKSSAIAALQASGEGSYDQVREVLKGVSVDASGKVELEDWVEVSSRFANGRKRGVD